MHFCLLPLVPLERCAILALKSLKLILEQGLIENISPFSLVFLLLLTCRLVVDWQIVRSERKEKEEKAAAAGAAGAPVAAGKFTRIMCHVTKGGLKGEPKRARPPHKYLEQRKEVCFYKRIIKVCVNCS